MKTLLIYGAVGYTGRMAAKQARAAGVDVIIAGRDVLNCAGPLVHTAKPLMQTCVTHGMRYPDIPSK